MLARLIVPLALLAVFAPSAQAKDAATPREVLHRSAAALDGRSDGREVTPLLGQLALVLPELDGADRRRARGILARPTQGDASSGDAEYRTAEHSPPHCTPRFCIHWVDTTSDAPPLADQDGDTVPDYVETMGDVFEQVYAFENDRLGWPAPKSDGARGCPGAADFCANRTDVYIQDVGRNQVYGYAGPDPGQRSFSQQAYLVMDNDYAANQFPQYEGNPLPPMQVTAAHEYNHVLQFGIDVAQDTWMFESTATWMEDQVFTDVNDYLQYVDAWTRLTPVPLTNFNSQSSNDQTNAKAYGANVWNRWLEGRFGADVIRDAWLQSLRTDPKSFAPAAYDRALRVRGSSFAEAFARFSADTAEWRLANSPFAEGTSFPDVRRAGNVSLRPGSLGASGGLDHTGYYLIDVPPADVPRLKLVFAMTHGPATALALVGREGDEVGGSMTSSLARTRRGGTATVVVDNPGRFSRLTAMITNADIRQRGFSRLTNDWAWRYDRQRFEVRVSTDFEAPGVATRSPRAGQGGVSPRPRITALFSERMSGVGSGTVRLIGPGGPVKARVKLKSRRRLTVTPRRALRRGRLYTVKLSADVRDLGGNKLPASLRTWRFRTAR